MASRALHRLASILQTNTVYMTYLVMFGNGALTGIARTPIRNSKVVNPPQSTRLDQMRVLILRNPVWKNVFSEVVPSFALINTAHVIFSELEEKVKYRVDVIT